MFEVGGLSQQCLPQFSNPSVMCDHFSEFYKPFPTMAEASESALICAHCCVSALCDGDCFSFCRESAVSGSDESQEWEHRREAQ